MKLLISPAKSLDFEKALPFNTTSTPIFKKEAEYINSVLKEKKPKDLSDLMHISDALASLNWERNQNFNETANPHNSRAAIYSFNGDVYLGLDAYTLSKVQLDSLQDKLRILSGLYGLLKPLDLIRPYRLEMGTSLQLDTHKNLYSFWKQKITDQLNKELKKNEVLVNLASNEYFSAVDHKAIKVPIITPQFKDYKNGKLKVISFFAKKARGLMVRHLIEQNGSTIDDIKGFTSGGYAFSDSETANDQSPVFVR